MVRKDTRNQASADVHTFWAMKTTKLALPWRPRFSLRAFLLAVAACAIVLGIATAWNGRPAEHNIEFSESLWRVDHQRFLDKLGEHLSANGLTRIAPSEEPLRGTEARQERIGVQPMSFRGTTAAKQAFQFDLWIYESSSQPGVFSAMGVMSHRDPYLRTARKAAWEDASRTSQELRSQVELSKWEAKEAPQK